MGLSWLNMAQQCSSATGWCTGEITSPIAQQTTDLNNLRWATLDEVQELVYETSGLPQGALDSGEFFVPGNNPYGEALFRYLETTHGYYIGPVDDPLQVFKALTATTRDLSVDPTGSLRAGLANITYTSTKTPGVGYSGTDIQLNLGFAYDVNEPYFGVFAYREVPEPGTFGMLCAGLLGMWLARSRKKRGTML